MNETLRGSILSSSPWDVDAFQQKRKKEREREKEIEREVRGERKREGARRGAKGKRGSLFPTILSSPLKVRMSNIVIIEI